jgi:ATPase subunit of ABC transporter with duplicated ATPase domains
MRAAFSCASCASSSSSSRNFVVLNPKAGMSAEKTKTPFLNDAGLCARGRRDDGRTLRRGRLMTTRTFAANDGGESVGKKNNNNSHHRNGRGSETWKNKNEAKDEFSAKNKNCVVEARQLKKTHDGERYQFDGLDFSLSEGQKFAVVGPNGSGKSTLLEVIGGKEEQFQGEMWRRKNSTFVLVEQEPEFQGSMTVLEALYAANTPLTNLLKRYEEITNNSEGSNEEVHSGELTKVLEEMDAANAWDAERRVKETLKKFGLGQEFFQKTTEKLSIGEKKRLALAAALIESPDVLILDEPTNHLSVEGVEFLETAVRENKKMAALVVSHDRQFIDNVSTNILELDGFGGGHQHGSGGYSSYLEGRERRWQAEAKDLASAKNTLRKEAEWMRRQPKARSTKEKARIERFYSLSQRASEKGTKGKTLDISTDVKSTRMGDVVVEFDNAMLKFSNEKVILDGFTYAFSKKEKIGIVGPNGAGKTTFIKALLGEIPLDDGFVNVGETIRFGYYSQTAEFADDEQRVFDYVTEVDADVKAMGYSGFQDSNLSARALLEKFNFGGSKQATPIGMLSGGEQRRLQLLTVLAKRPNFLILDEPTNDLDLDTIEVLEQLLVDFDGCVLIVSHDRAFVNTVADHIFVFDGKGGISDWSGSYTELREYIRETQQQEANGGINNDENCAIDDNGVNTSTETGEPCGPVLTREMEKEALNAPKIIAKIEKAIAVIDEDISKLDAEMVAAENDYGKLAEIQRLKDEKVTKQESYFAEYMRLEEVIETVESIRNAQAAAR